jgi:hypothetical protein
VKRPLNASGCCVSALDVFSGDKHNFLFIETVLGHYQSYALIAVKLMC